MMKTSGIMEGTTEYKLGLVIRIMKKFQHLKFVGGNERIVLAVSKQLWWRFGGRRMKVYDYRIVERLNLDTMKPYFTIQKYNLQLPF